jgi:hypothetical protein
LAQQWLHWVSETIEYSWKNIRFEYSQQENQIKPQIVPLKAFFIDQMFNANDVKMTQL